MRSRWATRGFLSLLIFVAGHFPALAGDSVYGKVTSVKTAELVKLNYGSGEYAVRLAGIEVPSAVAAKAKEFVETLVLGKNARMRLVRRTGNEMESQLLTDDPVIGVKDVGIELLRNGLARRAPGGDERYGYKYGELAAAEYEGRTKHRGLWG